MEAKKHHLSRYWQCQLGGWALAGLFWSYQASFQGRFNLSIAALHLGLDMAIGIGLTHAYQLFSKKQGWQYQPVRQLAGKLVLGVLLLSGLYMVLVCVKNFQMQYLFNQGYTQTFALYIQTSAVTLFVTGIRLMAIWVLIYHLYHYAQREMRITRENARLLVMSKDAQLANLQAQINPHFLFNSLNNIKSLVMENPGAARRGIDLLSDLLRNSLYKNDRQLITVNTELEMVSDYLELETLRFEERLHFDCLVDEKARGSLIPPLSIQGLVENAIKHGVDRRKAGGTISIKVAREAKTLQVRVSNPGTLLTEKATSGLGLQNLRERLALQFGGLSSFELTQSGADLVTATLIIPAL